MRSRSRDKQTVYFSAFTQNNDSIDGGFSYDTPTSIKVTVSATSDAFINSDGVGIVPKYDRVITAYKKLPLVVGMRLWVDVIPELDADGELILDFKGDPTVKADYKVIEPMETAKGHVFRYGIKKLGGTNAD